MELLQSALSVSVLEQLDYMSQMQKEALIRLFTGRFNAHLILRSVHNHTKNSSYTAHLVLETAAVVYGLYKELAPEHGEECIRHQPSG